MSKLSLRDVMKKRAVLHIHNLQNHPFSSSSSLTAASANSVEISSIGNSSAVEYLINSCGLSLERALKASKYVKFKAADRPDSVLAFFKDHGFTLKQISKTINYAPQVLVFNPQKTLLPKFQFLKSKGYSDADISVIISKSPRVLLRSLENQLIPSFNFFINLLQPYQLDVTKHNVGFLMIDLEKHGMANICILKEAGVPIPNINYLLTYHPRAFMAETDKFRQHVDEIKRMGFDPWRMTFLIAVKVVRSMTKSTWDKKVSIYKKWGWSEKDIAAAFLYYPACMAVSEDKISLVMEFWVNEMGWESSFLATVPTIMAMSLEKRIIPRCYVYQALLSKGIKKPCRISLSTWLTIDEKSFIQKIIDRHEEEAPGLLKLYNEKMDTGNG